LYLWSKLADQPQLLLCFGMAAGFFGPELPRLLPMLLRRFLGISGSK